MTSYASSWATGRMTGYNKSRYPHPRHARRRGGLENLIIFVISGAIKVKFMKIVIGW